MRKQQSATLIRGRFENFFKIVAEAHVEHFVGFIEHDIAQAGEIECAAFEVIAQAARGADDDLGPVVECTAFLDCVHTADTRCDAQARLGEQPHQFAADLQRQFARGCDHQRQGAAAKAFGFGFENAFGHGDAKGNRLARAGLCRHEQIAVVRFGRQNGGLNRGRFGIALFGQSRGDQRGK